MTTVLTGDDQLKQVAPKHKSISISEMFGPTIQGEGALIGKPTIFVRTGGCDYECPNCDTLYAVLPKYKDTWTSMTPHEVFAEIEHLSGSSPILVTLSGGNPALQPLEPLLDLGQAQGYTFALETQGSVAQPWFSKLNYLTLSPKGPTMIGTRETKWERLDRCISYALGNNTAISLKVVVFTEEDFAYARYVASRYPTIPMFLQVGNHTPPAPLSEGTVDVVGILHRLDWLVNRVTQEKWNTVTVLPQLHTLLWGNKRGV